MNNTHSSKKLHVADYAVVGAGLAGLLIARALAKEGAKVQLLEAADTAGGLNRKISSKMGDQENGLRFFPDSETSRRAIAFISQLIGREIPFESRHNQIKTFESGSLRPFVGFGSQSPEFYEELSYFLAKEQLQLSMPFHQIIDSLIRDLDVEFLPRHLVSRFHFADGKINSMTVNGQKTLHAQNIIYAGPLKSLKTLLPDEVFGVRAKQKFAKAQFWTAVGVDLIHPRAMTTEECLHVLNGTTADDIGPCVGRFSPSLSAEGYQSSQWLSFVDDESAEDTEQIGALLKKIKRQIKRAYPEALDGLISERISAFPSFSSSAELALTGHQTLINANNFWMASSGVHRLKNLVGTISQAMLVTSALGVNPLGTEIPHDNQAPQEVDEDATFS